MIFLETCTYNILSQIRFAFFAVFFVDAVNFGILETTQIKKFKKEILRKAEVS